MRVLGLVGMVLWPFLCKGQEVHVARANGSVALGVWAQQPYRLISGKEVMPMLSLGCTLKGKKNEHHLNFSPGGSLVDYGPEVIARDGRPLFNMTIGGIKQITTWVAYSDTVSFTYSGRREAERLKFIHSLLNSGSVSIEFMPFTGLPTTAVFDLRKLRDEMDKYPECITK